MSDLIRKSCEYRERDKKAMTLTYACPLTNLHSYQVYLGLGLMGWSLLPDALRPFKIYCASLSITSQLVLFLWQTVEIDTLGHVREALQIFVKKCDPVILSKIQIHIAGVQQFHCR